MCGYLSCRDEEVTIEKVMSEAERAREEAKRAAEGGGGGGGGGAVGRGDMAERALKQMMGGTLVGKQVWRGVNGVGSLCGSRAESDGDIAPNLTSCTQAEENPYFLEKPEWMDGNPKLFSEEQIKVRRSLGWRPWMGREP